MVLIWSGKQGYVQCGDQRRALHEPPFLPFNFDLINYDETSGTSYLSLNGISRYLNDWEIQRCHDWIIDAFDGGV